MKREITEEQASFLWSEEGSDDLGLNLHKEGDWDGGGKYQHCSNIYKDTKGKFWMLTASRSGSYFTYWDVNFSTELYEVREKEVVTTKWVSVD